MNSRDLKLKRFKEHQDRIASQPNAPDLPKFFYDKMAADMKADMEIQRERQARADVFWKLMGAK